MDVCDNVAQEREGSVERGPFRQGREEGVIGPTPPPSAHSADHPSPLGGPYSKWCVCARGRNEGDWAAVRPPPTPIAKGGGGREGALRGTPPMHITQSSFFLYVSR